MSAQGETTRVLEEQEVESRGRREEGATSAYHSVRRVSAWTGPSSSSNLILREEQLGVVEWQ